MDLFYFSGDVPPSKSLLNRALVIQQFNPQLDWAEASDATDVVYLKQALTHFHARQKNFYCADGGTTFRFLSVFLSRHPGRYEIEIAPALKARPHDGLFEILQQLGVTAKWSHHLLILETEGWKQDQVVLQANQTSQMASALILSAWNLPKAMSVVLPRSIYEYGYFQMTLKTNQLLGFQYEAKDLQNDQVQLMIPARQIPRGQKIVIEPDLSSCFPLAVLGALKQPVHLKNFPQDSLQPDFHFLEIFKKAKVAFDLSHNGLKVFPSQNLKAFQTNVQQCPDLFPVLCVFASFCDGKTEISGLDRLSFKESDRLLKTVQLLQMHGVHLVKNDHAVMIEGDRKRDLSQIHSSFDPAHDHRMAMAATIFQIMGSPVTLTDAEVFKKSFPEFTTYVRSLLPYLVDSHMPGGLAE